MEPGQPPAESADPADCLTLVMPLQARAGMTTDDFYEY
jgi:hypothetical protein